MESDILKRGYTEYKTVDSFSYTLVYKLYSKGKLIEYEVCPSTLPDGTYSVSAVAINGIILDFAVCELRTVGNAGEKFCSREIDIREEYIPEYLLMSIGEVYNICVEKHNKDGIYYDGL
jgi:hypothetical protein